MLPVEFFLQERVEANFLVEEFMLLANQKVGEILSEEMRDVALLRKHSFPGEKKIAKFEDFTKKVGFPLKIDREMKIQ